MNAAWEQVGDVLEANRRIRLAPARREVVGAIWYARAPRAAGRGATASARSC